MLLVTIINIDGSYHGVFECDDYQVAADLALADLIKNHGFFKQNRIVPLPDAAEPDLPHVFGLVLLDGEFADEVVYREETFYVQVRPVPINSMFQ